MPYQIRKDLSVLKNKPIRCVAVFQTFVEGLLPPVVFGKTGMARKGDGPNNLWRFSPDGSDKKHICSGDELYFPNHEDGFNQSCFKFSKDS